MSSIVTIKIKNSVSFKVANQNEHQTYIFAVHTFFHQVLVFVLDIHNHQSALQLVTHAQTASNRLVQVIIEQNKINSAVASMLQPVHLSHRTAHQRHSVLRSPEEAFDRITCFIVDMSDGTDDFDTAEVVFENCFGKIRVMIHFCSAVLLSFG